MKYLSILLLIFSSFSYSGNGHDYYDREKAVSYALEWGGDTAKKDERYNPYYSYYESNDCTNFVSQSLEIGGWKLEPESLPTNFRGTDTYDGIEYWFFSNKDRLLLKDSKTWVNAQSFYERMKKGYENVEFIDISNTEILEIGDFLSIDWEGDKIEYDHTAIITKIEDGEIHLTYHSNHRTNIALSKVIEGNPDSNYVFWHIKDSDFPENYKFVPYYIEGECSVPDTWTVGDVYRLVMDYDNKSDTLSSIYVLQNYNGSSSHELSGNELLLRGEGIYDVTYKLTELNGEIISKNMELHFYFRDESPIICNINVSN